MRRAIADVNPTLTDLEASCFDGNYITGDITRDYLDRLEATRNGAEVTMEDSVASQLHLNLTRSE